MSKLEENEVIFCNNCNCPMKEILLCIRKSRLCNEDNKQRCQNIVCKECLHCYGCEKRFQELRHGLKQNRYGRKDQLEGCKWYLNELKNQYDLDF